MDLSRLFRVSELLRVYMRISLKCENCLFVFMTTKIYEKRFPHSFKVIVLKRSKMGPVHRILNLFRVLIKLYYILIS